MEHDVVHQAVPTRGVVEAQRAAEALLRRRLRRAAAMTRLLVQIQLPPKRRDEANERQWEDFTATGVTHNVWVSAETF